MSESRELPFDGLLHRLMKLPSPTELLPEVLRTILPPLRAQEQAGIDAIAYVKYFSPYTNWTWFATEFDGEDLFFGFVAGFEEEWGYFALSELIAQGALIERDMAFAPMSISTLRSVSPDASDQTL